MSIRAAAEAATTIFNLPNYGFVSTGAQSLSKPTSHQAASPVVSWHPRRKERRFQRLGDIPVAGFVKVLWSKYRWHCEDAGLRAAIVL